MLNYQKISVLILSLFHLCVSILGLNATQDASNRLSIIYEKVDAVLVQLNYAVVGIDDINSETLQDRVYYLISTAQKGLYTVQAYTDFSKIEDLILRVQHNIQLALFYACTDVEIDCANANVTSRENNSTTSISLSTGTSPGGSIPLGTTIDIALDNALDIISVLFDLL